MSKGLVEIDGSVLEGGGQILRIALTISAIKKIPIRVVKIRAGRNKPGLMEQHLKGLELMRDMCNGRLTGGHMGSTEIQFWPNELKGGTYTAKIKTAGSITLLLQVAVPAALFADSATVLNITGGTNTEMAPQIDFYTEVFRPNLEKFGATFDFELRKRGYFPKGNGEVSVTVDPVAHLNPVILTERGSITDIYGWSYTAGTVPIRLAYLLAENAEKLLKEYGHVAIQKYKEDPKVAPDNSSGLVLVAETTTHCVLGGSGMFRKNAKVEEIGEEAANKLIHTITEGACVDEYTQDQIVILMALAKGESKVRIGAVTMHTKTAIFVIELLLPQVKFEIIPDGKTNILKCNGCGN
ncbi:unnamed protein product [Acanthoscelides obtectus]|uniref:RNA 3'-terminal phosphate cyclase n=1 Tax=Acanthoscelides obtectus TaxID=200917 RepID=A0A9P0LB27_ACAOB|nr:unnamed protein product [Acanthoscelides obtectus]CAK1619994.1 RNA 3'-terminal phosphate cyclase [Acanthoscelides obtectus]